MSGVHIHIHHSHSPLPTRPLYGWSTTSQHTLNQLRLQQPTGCLELLLVRYRVEVGSLVVLRRRSQIRVAGVDGASSGEEVTSPAAGRRATETASKPRTVSGRYARRTQASSEQNTAHSGPCCEVWSIVILMNFDCATVIDDGDACFSRSCLL